jgi:hypothetical protein
MPVCIPLFVVSVMLWSSARAQAEPSPPDRAIAERLYDQGRKQLAEGQVAAACESFAESLRLDPGTGILLNLAACHESLGRLASAWVEFREAVAAIRREGRADRMRYAQERLSVIEPRLAHLTIEIPEAAAGDAPAVTLDARTLGAAVWGVPIPVDAGWHEVVAQSARGTVWRATVKIRDGEQRQLAVPLSLVTVRSPPAPPAAAAVTANQPAQKTAPEDADPGRGRARRVAAVTLGAVGLVSVAVGSYFGLHASSLWNDRNRQCPMERCTADGVRLGERADTSATIATWTIGAGVVTMGAAVLLWLSSPDRAAPSSTVAGTMPNVGVDGRGTLLVGGVF